MTKIVRAMMTALDIRSRDRHNRWWLYHQI